jgi:hypothetical protein
MERRDYPLPIGIYRVPEASESSDRRRADFSWALEGESAASSADDDSGSELGHHRDDDAATYTAGRLAKLAGGTAGQYPNVVVSPPTFNNAFSSQSRHNYC